MPAMTKDKLIKHVHTPSRIHPRCVSNTDVKRLGPSRRISSKRTQSIETQTVLACLILHDTCKQTDEGTQTNDDTFNFNSSASDNFASRLVRFFGGTIVSFMKLFGNMK